MKTADHTGEAPAALGSTPAAIAGDLERIAVSAVGLTTRALGQAETGFELTFPQWRAILVVGEDEEGTRIGAVATRVGVTLPATSRLLRRLERRGLMGLESDELDRRAMRARLTARGHAVRQTILAYRQTRLGEVVDSLPEDGQLDLATGLRAIANELERFA